MNRPLTFAEVVAALPPPPQVLATYEWPGAINKKQWTDRDGVGWRMRGSVLTRPVALRRLVFDPAVRLLLWWCDPEPHTVPDDQQEPFWQRLERETGQLTTGKASYEAAEFRSEQGAKLLIVEAFC